MGFFSKKPKQLSPEKQNNLNGRLINAALCGIAKTVRALLADGADVHAWNDLALQWAVEDGHTETVQVLLASGANLHMGGWALRCAAGNGHTETVKALLASGVNVHTADDLALSWAAARGRTQTVKVLLAAGADVHADNDRALRWAAEVRWDAPNGHTEAVKVLQEALKAQEAKRLELERQQNPLYAGAGLMLPEFRPEDMDALLREATAEQMAPGRSNGREREFVLPPLTARPSP